MRSGPVRSPDGGAQRRNPGMSASLHPGYERVARFLQSIWAGLRRLTGDDAYERYVAHCREHHPGSAPLTRADFFRAEQDRRWNGVRRCC